MTDESEHNLIGEPGTAEFILLASHGLRSPLTAIRWGLEVLSKEKLGKNNAEQQELTIELHRNAQEMTSILRSMIVLTRLQSRIHSIEHTDIPITDVCNSVTEQYKAWASVRSVKCTVQYTDDLHIQSDPQIFRDTIAHIISLSIDTSPKGSAIELSLTREDNGVHIHCSGEFQLPDIRPVQDTLPLSEDKEIVGGTPGLLIFLIRKLSKSMGWEFYSTRNETGVFTSLGIHILQQ